MVKGINQKTASGSGLDFEARLWAAACKMRGHMANLMPIRKDSATHPFKMSDWSGEHLRHGVRWKFGKPLRNVFQNLA
jgi:hypothetical protein